MDAIKKVISLQLRALPVYRITYILSYNSLRLPRLTLLLYLFF
jgi:hypothetical protein